MLTDLYCTTFGRGSRRKEEERNETTVLQYTVVSAGLEGKGGKRKEGQSLWLAGWLPEILRSLWIE